MNPEYVAILALLAGGFFHNDARGASSLESGWKILKSYGAFEKFREDRVTESWSDRRLRTSSEVTWPGAARRCSDGVSFNWSKLVHMPETKCDQSGADDALS